MTKNLLIRKRRRKIKRIQRKSVNGVKSANIPRHRVTLMMILIVHRRQILQVRKMEATAKAKIQFVLL